MSYGAKLPAYFTHSPSASVRAAGALFGGAQAPLAEARLELAAEQESNDPATEQQQKFECFGGHQRQSPGLIEMVCLASATRWAANIAFSARRCQSSRGL